MSIDLKDAYFSIPMDRKFQPYLCFTWAEKYFCFTCLPLGLSSAPRIFTKVMKPVVASVRSQGISLVIYLDDFFVMFSSKEESITNTNLVINPLKDLGFEINYKKSHFIPETKATYLGFIIDSETMSIYIPRRKVEKIKVAVSAIDF